MKRNTGRHIVIYFTSILSIFFLTEKSFAAYNIKVNLNTSGGGDGSVALSATSSNIFQFSGWLGESGESFSDWSEESRESCESKRGNCVLKKFISNSSRVVIAAFNAPTCTEFTYSDFGACQLSGSSYRNILSANPPGCVGGNPILSKQCFYDVCLGGSAQNLSPDKAGIIDALIEFYRRLTEPVKPPKPTPPLPSIPPSAIGGGAGGSDNFNVVGSGGQKAGAGGGVVTIPDSSNSGGGSVVAPSKSSPVLSPIPNIDLPNRPTPEPIKVTGPDDTRTVHIGEPPIEVIAPRVPEPNTYSTPWPDDRSEPTPDFQFDPNFGKPRLRCD